MASCLQLLVCKSAQRVANLEEVALVTLCVHEVAQPADWIIASKDVAAIGMHEGERWPLVVTGAVEALGCRLLNRSMLIKQIDRLVKLAVNSWHDIH